MRTIRGYLLALLAVLSGAAAAQPAFPDKPIRLVIPFAAGGTTDIMARVLQEPLQKSLGQTLIVDNKPGASGVLAAREVIRARPDGHTLFFVNNGNVAVAPAVVKDANYDGLKDFTPVTLVATAPLMAVVPAALPVDDLRGFIEYAKKQPVAYATAGIGSFGHLATELFARRAGIKMTHVPYKGQGPTTNAVIAGEVQLLITTASAAMNEFIANKRLKLLAVTSPEPSPIVPGAPTMASVLPGYAAESWFAIIGPAGMPADVVDKLNDAIARALQIPDVQQRFTGFGVLAKSSTPRQLADRTAAEIARWAPVIRESNIRAE
ncbi:Bug family tripartite tricarboxylate transporter substrate binding protein [Piscinibacter koreensis]|uniref:Tripartite tricarboxylate transporter substrate binding protein n=1 Tax=Piscinibacter koreensis TaxID=2742824 RepID=A0A7Y6NKE4_9BURK|nr:tripartite tricarboxylate transporter substrate binding protein [Schlegelella koreensis]NUZ04734.1 tripartite tricarboxylate transporter substrate binding protein [Schlegelella koreensis]